MLWCVFNFRWCFHPSLSSCLNMFSQRWVWKFESSHLFVASVPVGCLIVLSMCNWSGTNDAPYSEFYWSRLFKTSLTSSGFILMRFTISCFLLVPVSLMCLWWRTWHKGRKQKGKLNVREFIELIAWFENAKVALDVLLPFPCLIRLCVDDTPISHWCNYSLGVCCYLSIVDLMFTPADC